MKPVFTLLLVFFSTLAPLSAQEDLPGDTTLPSSKKVLDTYKTYDKGRYKYSIEDYFKKPDASFFQLSPKGTYLSFFKRDNDGKQHIFIKNTATKKSELLVREKDEKIKGYGWVSDDQIVYGMDNGGDENYHIYSINITDKQSRDLTPFKGVQAHILNVLKDDKDHVIISMNKNNPQVFEPYKVNIKSGKMQQLYTNNDPSNPISSFIFDKDGNLRAIAKTKGLQNDLYYKNLKTNKFELVNTTDWDDTFAISAFNYNSKNPDDAYIVSNLEEDTETVYLYDFKKKKILKTLFHHKTYDASAPLISNKKRNYELDGFSYYGEKSVIVPKSAFFKKLYGNLSKYFHEGEFFIADGTDDEEKFLVVNATDKLAGVYYIYEYKTDTLTKLHNVKPHLNPNDMADVKPITFTSRDGLTIHGYVSIPKGIKKDQKIPLIVIPHGGPQGIRDYWGFRSDIQLFASRGYASLMVNFRISGGYGKKFLQAGFKQPGRKIMDDIEDGVNSILKEGWVDKNKIAIYGASHGGYAVLMGLAKTPDLYVCGVDYVGVSNIETLIRSIPPYWKPYIKQIKQIWYDIDSPEELKLAREVSPVYQADKIKHPVFVIQGANDPRVNINESDQIVRVLRKKGIEVPYMVKYNEGHGFSREENNLDLYESAMGFLAKCLQ